MKIKIVESTTPVSIKSKLVSEIKPAVTKLQKEFYSTVSQIVGQPPSEDSPAVPLMMKPRIRGSAYSDQCRVKIELPLSGVNNSLYFTVQLAVGVRETDTDQLTPFENMQPLYTALESLYHIVDTHLKTFELEDMAVSFLVRVGWVYEAGAVRYEFSLATAFNNLDVGNTDGNFGTNIFGSHLFGSTEQAASMEDVSNAMQSEEVYDVIKNCAKHASVRVRSYHTKTQNRENRKQEDMRIIKEFVDKLPLRSELSSREVNTMKAKIYDRLAGASASLIDNVEVAVFSTGSTRKRYMYDFVIHISSSSNTRHRLFHYQERSRGDSDDVAQEKNHSLEPYLYTGEIYERSANYHLPEEWSKWVH